MWFVERPRVGSSSHTCWMLVSVRMVLSRAAVAGLASS